MFKLKIFFICVFLFLGLVDSAFAVQWNEKTSEHFIIRYVQGEDEVWMNRVLMEAERYYQTVAGQLGYERYTNFWTWEHRVQIIVYKDRNHFIKETGQPIWAVAGVKRDDSVWKTKKIVSYKQEDVFLEGVLPHEIAHLIAFDYFSHQGNIPVWFDEGLAQIFELGKVEKANTHLRVYLKNNTHIPFKEFVAYNPRYDTNPLKVSYFYIQSASVVDFLIRQYGSTRFMELCGLMKDGALFEDAFRGAYLGVVDSFEDLERKWLNYIVY